MTTTPKNSNQRAAPALASWEEDNRCPGKKYAFALEAFAGEIRQRREAWHG